MPKPFASSIAATKARARQLGIERDGGGYIRNRAGVILARGWGQYARIAQACGIVVRDGAGWRINATALCRSSHPG